MVVPTIAGFGVSSFNYTLLSHGLATFDARLAGDIMVTVGDIVPVAWNDIANTITQMEVVEYGDAGTQRWHILLQPVGSTLLSTSCIPTFISKPTPDLVISALYQGVYNLITPKVFTQDNITLPNYITNFQALSRYFGTSIRFDFNGVLQIGDPIPQPNLGSFGLMNPNISARVLEVALTGDDVIINPGDIIFNTAIVDTVEIIGGMDRVRLKVKLTKDSPPPTIFAGVPGGGQMSSASSASSILGA